MLSANGTDYTLFAVGTVLFLLPAILQYILCAKAKKRFFKILPFVFGAVFLVLAAAVLASKPYSFIDLRQAVAVLLVGGATICFAGQAAGWVAYKIKRK